MNTYELTERDILAIIKIAMDEKTVLNRDMKLNLLEAAQELELTEQEKHDAAIHVYNTYEHTRDTKNNKAIYDVDDNLVKELASYF